MEERETVILCDEEGNEEEFEVIACFEVPEQGKIYTVYTDDIEGGELYACYQEIGDEDYAFPVEDEEELAMVEDILDSIMES